MPNVEYPRFMWIDSRGIIPSIPLPPDFEKFVPAFYATGGRERIERYAENIAKNASGVFSDSFNANLNWDETRGLKNISVTPSSGLDLNERDRFQEHNLGGVASLVTGAIAMEYVAVLMSPHIR